MQQVALGWFLAAFDQCQLILNPHAASTSVRSVRAFFAQWWYFRSLLLSVSSVSSVASVTVIMQLQSTAHPLQGSQRPQVRVRSHVAVSRTTTVCHSVGLPSTCAAAKHRSQHQQTETTNSNQWSAAAAAQPLPQTTAQKQKQEQQDGSSVQPQSDAMQLLERSYQQPPVPNSADQPRAKRPAASSSSKLRPLVIRSALPVLRTIRFTERRLEADLLTIAATVMLVVGFIIWDRGVEELLDGLLGDGPRGSVFCIVVGLGIVVAVRLSGFKLTRIFTP